VSIEGGSGDEKVYSGEVRCMGCGGGEIDQLADLTSSMTGTHSKSRSFIYI
jgi:hypothetical protein